MANVKFCFHESKGYEATLHPRLKLFLTPARQFNSAITQVVKQPFERVSVNERRVTGKKPLE